MCEYPTGPCCGTVPKRWSLDAVRTATSSWMMLALLVAALPIAAALESAASTASSFGKIEGGADSAHPRQFGVADRGEFVW